MLLQMIVTLARVGDKIFYLKEFWPLLLNNGEE